MGPLRLELGTPSYAVHIRPYGAMSGGLCGTGSLYSYWACIIKASILASVFQTARSVNFIFRAAIALK
jgi:hypothetical protein